MPSLRHVDMVGGRATAMSPTASVSWVDVSMTYFFSSVHLQYFLTHIDVAGLSDLTVRDSL